MLANYEIGDNALYPKELKDVVWNQNMALRLLGSVLANLAIDKLTGEEETDDDVLTSLSIAIKAIEANEMWLEMNNASD
jgi:hypothetical protein